MATSQAQRLVVGFAESDTDDRALLGGKGAGLVQMTRQGIPVPPGFILTTECGRQYRQDGILPVQVQMAVEEHLSALEGTLGRRFGDLDDPLLVSVRSGAPVSMPGMMDTILNVGLTPASVAKIAETTGDARFAYSSFEHLLTGYAVSVLQIPHDVIDDVTEDHDRSTAEGARGRCEALSTLIEEESGRPFPAPAEQLAESIGAVFRSWDNPRARAYRDHKGIDEDQGTVVVIQAMVYGNRSDDSGSGVVFTRNPATGEPGACGEYLARAQGEDVVSGEFESGSFSTLAEQLPETARQLSDVLETLERATGDMCDVEFTIERGHAWILQTRVGQRSSRAAVRIAVDLAHEGVISPAEAVRRIEQRTIARLPRTAEPEPPASTLIARGIASSSGAVVGRACFDADTATTLAEEGDPVVLIRPTTSPADMAGLIAASAVVTGRGGPMSHAAVVARGMDRPAVCGVGEVAIADDRRSATVDGQLLNVGDPVTVDGDNGWVARGEVALVDPGEDPHFQQFRQWCQELGQAEEARTS